MRNDAKGTLKPCFKAAIFLLAVEPEESAQIFAELNSVQAEAIARAVPGLPEMTDTLRHRVLLEFTSGRAWDHELRETSGIVVTETKTAIQRMIDLGWLPAKGKAHFDMQQRKNQCGYITAIRKPSDKR